MCEQVAGPSRIQNWPCPGWRALPLALGLLLPLGCDAGDTPAAKSDGPAREATKAAETSRKMIGKNVYFETQGDQRRVLIATTVALREGPLEGLLSKPEKSHEYILSVQCDARHIHAALIAAGAKSGAPVKFEPKYEPASGSEIKISLQYEEKGKQVTVPAGKWIRNKKTRKDLDINWVFAGSRFAPDPMDKQKPPIYLANYGDMICVCNIEDAMLDLPIRSVKSFDDRAWEANTDSIPALDTKVVVILEPIREKGDKKDK